jgi:hypothetical protein
MNIKIQGGGQGAYANNGSCAGVTNYLAHEDIERVKAGQEPVPYFTHDRDNAGAREVTYKIDHNKGQLHKNDSKFFVITVSPSAAELQSMGGTPEQKQANFKFYINDGVMNLYAEGFGKGLTNKDLLYYAKIHYTRGDKAGDQMHAHIIVSRKDVTNSKKLSPQTNHRTGNKGAVKSGFCRDDFFRKCEHSFDSGFNYRRDFEQSYDYQNTMKNGSLEQIKQLDNVKHQHEQRQEQTKERHQENVQGQRQHKNRNRGVSM